MIVFLASWTVAASTYVLFAGQFSADELVASALSGLVVSVWSASLRKVAPQPFAFERGAWGVAARALGSLPVATGKVALALMKAIAIGGKGELQRQTFIGGELENSTDAGRRAIAVLARSLAPDRFVIRLRRSQDALDLHALVKMDEGDRRWAV